MASFLHIENIVNPMLAMARPGPQLTGRAGNRAKSHAFNREISPYCLLNRAGVNIRSVQSAILEAEPTERKQAVWTA